MAKVGRTRLFSLFEHWWKSRLSDLGDFLRISESGLGSQFKDWGNRFDERTGGSSDQEKEELIDHLYDDLATVRDTVPGLFRRAAFVMVLGVFESLVADTCRFLHQSKVTRRKPKQRLYLERAEKYLADVGGVSEALASPSWEYLKKAMCLRHAIIHNNARVPRTAEGKIGEMVKNAQAFVAGQKGVSLSWSGDVKMEQGVCEAVLDRVFDCASVLLSELLEISSRKRLLEDAEGEQE